MNTQRVSVAELKPGMGLDQIFVVRKKELRTTKNGDLFINLDLGDRTGAAPARMWQATQAMFDSIQAEGFLHIFGRAEDYRGSLQLVVEAARPVPADQVNLEDFIPVSPFDIEEMWAEMVEILRGVKNRYLRMLVKKFLEDTDLIATFKTAPAAVQMHQAYCGGLLEHTLNIARAAKALLPLYPQLNGDLIYVSAFLHDIAKAGELSGGLSIRYTDQGQLVGHITMACLWVQEKARLVAEEQGEPFPVKTVDLLHHMILSHHGIHEYGSPKLPAIPEAYFLHYLDNLDAKMWMTAHAIADDPDQESHFTPYIRALETRLYKHSAQLDG